MPRRPPSELDPSAHVMGQHVLFHNASTSKRFPFLASVPQNDLANMFRVPLVDREEEKRHEMRFSEPYLDQRIQFREAARDKKPFVPTNAAAAKETLVGTKESVYVGTYRDAELSEKRYLEESQKGIISQTPMFFGATSGLAAGEAIHNRYFLNAGVMNEKAAERVREMSKHRISMNRQLLIEQGYGKSPKRQRPETQLRLTASSQGLKPSLPTVSAPRPMSGLQAPNGRGARL